jgi:hypothetical protein
LALLFKKLQVREEMSFITCICAFVGDVTRNVWKLVAFFSRRQIGCFRWSAFAPNAQGLLNGLRAHSALMPHAHFDRATHPLGLKTSGASSLFCYLSFIATHYMLRQGQSPHGWGRVKSVCFRCLPEVGLLPPWVGLFFGLQQ